MKTHKGWLRSERELSDYLTPGDRIDEALYNRLGEVVPPVFCYDGFLQCGDCDRETEGVRFHMTASYHNGVYLYLGILPQFSND